MGVTFPLQCVVEIEKSAGEFCVVVFVGNEIESILPYLAAKIGLLHAALHLTHKFLGGIGNKEIDAVGIVNTLRSNGGSYHSFTNCHCLYDFHSDAAARKQWHHINLLGGNKIDGVGHFAHNLHSVNVGIHQIGRHSASCQIETRLRHFAVQLRPYLGHKPSNTFLVGKPIHGTDMKHRILFHAHMLHQFCIFDTKRHLHNGTATSFSLKSFGIRVRDAHHTVEIIHVLSLVYAQGQSQMLQVP